MNASDIEGLHEAPQSAIAPTWVERNQQWLVREVAQLARCIDTKTGPVPFGTSGAPAGQTEAGEAAGAGDFVPALQSLAEIFGLSGFERNVLLLAAGVELDAGLRRAVAAARHGAPRPNFALALDRLPDAHWEALSPQSPLRYWHLITLETVAPLVEAGLGIDERVLHYLTGVTCTDETLRGLVHFLAPATDPRILPDEWIERVAAALLGDTAYPVLVVFDHGDSAQPGDDRSTVIATIARLGFETLLTYAHDLPSDPGELEEIARAIDREAALSRAVLVLDLDALCDHKHEHEARAAGFIAALRGPALLLGQPSRELLAAVPERRVRRLKLPASGARHARSGGDDALGRALRRALQQFSVGAATIEATLASIVPDAEDDETNVDAAVWQALREAARGGLDSLAQRIESRTSFDDLVLPPAQLSALRDITRHLRHRDRVHREWGFAEKSSRGLGLCALFAGDSGTGKTMAAEAIANEARLDLYRIDLATVVSKYIGETEKNLRRLFDAAEASGAVLLFDEADALFGKRSEVKDSHDRYANIEVAYLLQRIETYRGLAILTTNMKSALDRAFLRRIRFVVQFPFPDARAREDIWRRQFPVPAPVEGVDLAALSKLQLAGGHIRSIAITAAFKAADQSRAIDQQLLMDAARAEYAKLERAFTDVREGT